MISVNEWVDDAKEWFRRGVDKSRKGDYEAALQAFDQALQRHPTSADAYGHRCVARHQTGDKQGAIADCQHAAILYLEQGNVKDYQYALKMLEKLQK